MTAEPNKCDLVFTRVFDAPVELVWGAWVDPELVMQWWGPDGLTSPGARIDLREDGRSLVCLRAPKAYGRDALYSSWAYREIVPLERIEYIHNLADRDGNKIDPGSIGLPADFPQDQRNLVTFRDLGDGRTELTVTEYGWPVGPMTELSRPGMEQCLDRMAVVFASQFAGHLENELSSDLR